jgi:ribose transport system substrate-binding protein
MRHLRDLLMLVPIVALGACDSSSGPPKAGGAAGPGAKPCRFAFVSNNFSTFWTIAQKGLEKAKAELGVDVEFRAPKTGKVDEQQRIIEDLLVQGVDGIAISPIDPDNMVDLLNRAAAKVPLICQDSDAPKSNRLCYIGTDNYKAGREAGKAMKEALGEAGGKVAIFVGRIDAQNARDRRQGFLDEVQGAKIELVKDFFDYAAQSTAKQNAEDALTAYPDLTAMLGLWAYNGPAIAAAVKTAGKVGKIKIVCFDEEAEALQAIQDGVIYATVVQKPFEFGYRSMKLLKAIKDGKSAEVIPASKVIDTGVVTVTRENVVEFWAKLKELTK